MQVLVCTGAELISTDEEASCEVHVRTQDRGLQTAKECSRKAIYLMQGGLVKSHVQSKTVTQVSQRSRLNAR